MLPPPPSAKGNWRGTTGRVQEMAEDFFLKICCYSPSLSFLSPKIYSAFLEFDNLLLMLTNLRLLWIMLQRISRIHPCLLHMLRSLLAAFNAKLARNTATNDAFQELFCGQQEIIQAGPHPPPGPASQHLFPIASLMRPWGSLRNTLVGCCFSREGFA